MEVVIDTSILVDLERGRLTYKVLEEYEQCYISPITLTELLIGADRADNENRRIKRLVFIEYIINSLIILPFKAEEARIYAKIIDNLRKEKITIDTNDMLIATTAITHGYPLLTLNMKDFKRIQGLEVLTASLKD
ncbi:tRNA(fMet)-specific endonuclease VapC [Rickettsia tillamookensis]|uniref:Ribonuclease VapC n=1 Tax=Rickettsia tillamookensis TaxID=2761623 RepID=A0A9E6SQ52_9RICK|nr:PIN domain-containing protein [Rickettsia tillamookensis]QQV74848.1 tRNA(fMet)-specific endonuclease VapC [Rickettsia tillamookensis]